MDRDPARPLSVEDAKRQLHGALTVDLRGAPFMLRTATRARPLLAVAAAVGAGFALAASPALRRQLLLSVPRVLRRLT